METRKDFKIKSPEPKKMKNEEPLCKMPKIVVIGVTGSGKSTLCNILSGYDPNGEDENGFPASDSLNSCTYKTIGKEVNWLGNEELPFTIFDTPGLGDPSGNDSSNIMEMVQTLKKIRFVNAFVIVFNGQNPRIDLALKGILQIFKQIFGKDFLKNTIIQFSRWSFDKRASRLRSKNGITEKKHAIKWNQNFQKELGLDHALPVVYVDALYEKDDDDESLAFKTQSDKLWQIINEMDEYECKDFESVLAEHDQFRKQVEDAEENQKKAQENEKIAKENERKAGMLFVIKI